MKADTAKIIKGLMENAEMTQRELADKLGISEVAMSRYLSGHREITFEFFQRCLNAIMKEVNE